MGYNPDIHHRRSIRLQTWDYTRSGLYFVTICSFGRELVFGEVVDGEMVLSPMGHIAAGCWLWLAEQYAYVHLDAWVVMPNHLHGVIGLYNDERVRRGDSGIAQGAEPEKRKSLGRLVGAFKTVSTKYVNDLREMPGAKLWQRNYYETIIRNERHLQAVRDYIVANPFNWEKDEYYGVSK